MFKSPVTIPECVSRQGPVLDAHESCMRTVLKAAKENLPVVPPVAWTRRCRCTCGRELMRGTKRPGGHTRLRKLCSMGKSFHRIAFNRSGFKGNPCARSLGPQHGRHSRSQRLRNQAHAAGTVWWEFLGDMVERAEVGG